MGVLNVTPDSFSDGGQFLTGGRVDRARVAATAAEMVEAGAAILDVGGESTRPGALGVNEAEECRRVLPVVESLLDLDVIVSVDTTKVAVARRALDLGVHLINLVGGVTGGVTDPRMLTLLAAADAGIVIMHMQGQPGSMQRRPCYADVVQEVSAWLDCQVDACTSAGIARARLCVDPGFGFGKTSAHNLLLLRNLSMFKNGNVALLAGLSRKSLIGAITGRPVQNRLAGSVAAAVLAVQRGADIVRVHDVEATVDALEMLRAVEIGKEPERN
jgi:dihydropteroate synthase